MTDRVERRFWLMKSEPEECSIDDALAATQATVPWVGVRNYQARNFMRDAMRVGDGVVFWHSGCVPPGIAGLAEVASASYPDPTQFDPASPYFDPAAKADAPRWMLVDVRALRRTRFVEPGELRTHPTLAAMQVLKRGNRLSITPVSPDEWNALQALLA
ncbi:MAG: EVE domain-containing protein [Burkholderiales bacterium]|jgi:predicted RNA-binding protein with PUA-like domain